MKRMMLLVTATLLAAACGGAQAPEAAPRINRNVITVEEMRAQNIIHAEEAVRVLRPQWLRQHGATTFGAENAVRVYTDPSIRPLAGLHGLPQGRTAAVLYFPPLEAQTRFGLNHSHGAIAIVLPGGSLP